MKNDKYRTYIYWGVTALTVLLLLVAAVFVVMRWSLVAALGAQIANILAPVIYGAVFAYGILYYPSWQTSSENLISMLKIHLYYLLIFFIGFFLVAVTLQEIIIVNARFYCIYLFRLYPYPFQLFHFHWY